MILSFVHVYSYYITKKMQCLQLYSTCYTSLWEVLLKFEPFIVLQTSLFNHIVAFDYVSKLST
jgi:hypothetical protein